MHVVVCKSLGNRANDSVGYLEYKRVSDASRMLTTRPDELVANLRLSNMELTGTQLRERAHALEVSFVAAYVARDRRIVSQSRSGSKGESPTLASWGSIIDWKSVEIRR